MFEAATKPLSFPGELLVCGLIPIGHTGECPLARRGAVRSVATRSEQRLHYAPD